MLSKTVYEYDAGGGAKISVVVDHTDNGPEGDGEFALPIGVVTHGSDEDPVWMSISDAIDFAELVNTKAVAAIRPRQTGED